MQPELAESVQAIIPAAGRGTRLRPLTDETPKGLVSVAGRPLLAYVFERLASLPIEEMIVVVGHEGEQIISRFGSTVHGLPVHYVWQESQLGLAHALHQTSELVDGSFVVLNGDNVFCDPIPPIYDVDADGAVLVEPVPTDQARETGIVVTDGDGLVRDIVEKPTDPPSSISTTGAYYLPEDIMDTLASIEPSGTGEYELAAAIRTLLADGKTFRATVFSGCRQNVNTPADIACVERLLSMD